MLAGVVGWHRYQFRQARRAFDENRFDDANAHISRSLWLWRRDPEGLLLAARIARFHGKYAQAEELLREARAAAGAASEALQLELVLLRVHRGEIQAAATGLKACLDTDHPESALILKTLAATELRELRYHLAKRYLDTWGAREPDNATVHEWRGFALDRLDSRDEAIAAYQKCLDLAPDRWRPRLRLAELFLETVQPNEAKAHLEILARSRPGDADVLLALSRYHELVGDAALARQVSDQALALAPGHVSANLHRANLELKEDRPELAEKYARQGLATRAFDYQMNYVLLRSLTLQNKSDEAAALAAKLERINRDQARLKQLITEQLERPGDRRAVYHEVGQLFFSLSEHERGLEWFYKALELDPDYQPTHRFLMAHFEDSGEREKAEQHRQRVKEQ
jgi:tetratricopeptide (TPR) repeat protein